MPLLNIGGGIAESILMRLASYPIGDLKFSQRELRNVGVDFNISVSDAASPALRYGRQMFHMVNRISAMQMGYAIKAGVRNSYIKNSGKKPNSPLTVMIKGNSTPLKESGDLERAVNSVDDGVKIYSVQNNNVRVEISWDFPDSGTRGIAGIFRNNKNLSYVWVHEFGSGVMGKRAAQMSSGKFYVRDIYPQVWKLKARPFFQEGVRKGVIMAQGIYAKNLSDIFARMHDWKAPEYKALGVSAAPSLLTLGPVGFAMYFLPPSSLYKYPGMASDMAGVFKGTFNEKTIYAYIRQYMWGQMGITSKSIRRQGRRKLWGGYKVG